MQQKYIRLTNYETGEPTYVNIDIIGVMYERAKYTAIDTTNQQTGIFKVRERVSEILAMIEKLSC